MGLGERFVQRRHYPHGGELSPASLERLRGVLQQQT
jgi:hypothetical protein